MRNILINKKQILYDILPIFALILYSFREIFVGTSFLVLGGICILPYLFRFLKKRNYIYLKSFFFLTCLGILFCLLYYPDKSRSNLIVFIATFTLALWCLEHLKITKYLCYIVIIYTLSFLFYKIFIEQAVIAYIYEATGQSKNFPGFLLVAWISLLAFINCINGEKLPLILPILAIYISLFLDGRTSTAVLLAMILLANYNFIKKNKWFIIVIVACCIYLINNNIISNLYNLTTFNDRGLESSRFEMWNNFFDGMGLVDFIVGMDTRNIPIIKDYGGNPHNSLLFFQMNSGILGIVNLFMMILLAIKKYFKSKQYLILICFFLIFLRYFTDSLFFQSYDFIFYIYLFYPIYTMKSNNASLNFNKNE